MYSQISVKRITVIGNLMSTIPITKLSSTETATRPKLIFSLIVTCAIAGFNRATQRYNVARPGCEATVTLLVLVCSLSLLSLLFLSRCGFNSIDTDLDETSAWLTFWKLLMDLGVE
ncbi:unnamed protein product, partial [Trichogramma brassicae]